MEEYREEAKKEKDFYEYQDFPKNVRQIGVPLPGTKVYLEDYVITYLKQEFANINEAKIVILLGKKGSMEARQGVFVYGAIALESEDILQEGRIDEETWDHIHSTIHQKFSGAQVLGCACGVGLWNSEVDRQVRKLQRESFMNEGNILYLWDVSEKEERMYTWQSVMLKEIPGYYVYFERNPQMQDYMLGEQPSESIDADYKDTVTSSIRHVIEEKVERKQRIWQILTYCGAAAAAVAIILGVNMMVESTARIKEMEQTVKNLSQYVGQRQQELEAMTRQTETVAEQIPEESQTPKVVKKNQKKSITEQKDIEEKAIKSSNMAKSSIKPRESQVPVTPVSTMQQMIQDESRSYVVQAGDTLSQIVWNQYQDASYEQAVLKVNGITDADKIYEGQCLILPEFVK